MENTSVATAGSCHRFTHQQEEVELWTSVLHESLRHGNSASQAIGEANGCVKALRERFPVGEKDQADQAEVGPAVVGIMLRIKQAMGWPWFLEHRGLSPVQVFERFLRDYRPESLDDHSPGI